MTIYTSITQYNSEEQKRKRRQRARARMRAFAQAGGGHVAANDLTFLEGLGSATDLTTYTFAAAALGVAHANRMIIFTGTMRAAGLITLTSVTVQGIVGTVDKEERNVSAGNTSSTFIGHALVPTGTTGDIVVTWSGAGAVLQGLSTYRVTKYRSATPILTAGGQRTGAGTIDLTLAAAKGFQIGAALSHGGTNRRHSSAMSIGNAPASIVVDIQNNSTAWTGLTSNTNAIVESGAISPLCAAAAAWQYP